MAEMSIVLASLSSAKSYSFPTGVQEILMQHIPITGNTAPWFRVAARAFTALQSRMKELWYLADPSCWSHFQCNHNFFSYISSICIVK